jgi:hypothetical protein
MPVDAEKEITRLWRALHSAQDEIGKTYYRWRQVAVEFAGDDYLVKISAKAFFPA